MTGADLLPVRYLESHHSFAGHAGNTSIGTPPPPAESEPPDMLKECYKKKLLKRRVCGK
jgi:hypothetical protein